MLSADFSSPHPPRPLSILVAAKHPCGGWAAAAGRCSQRVQEQALQAAAGRDATRGCRHAAACGVAAGPVSEAAPCKGGPAEDVRASWWTGALVLGTRATRGLPGRPGCPHRRAACTVQSLAVPSRRPARQVECQRRPITSPSAAATTIKNRHSSMAM